MVQEAENINSMDFDVLTEIGNIGAGNAVTALSQMINARVDMYVPQVRMLTFQQLAEIIGGEETLVVGIMLSLEEDIEGSMLFLMEADEAHQIVAQMMGYTSWESGEFTEIEQSALTEVGNVITGAYLSAISKLTNLTIVPSIPYMAVDMAGAILSVPAIEFGKLGDQALLIESRFRDMDVDISGYFIMIPTLESYDSILSALGIG
ncbi:MAG: chemotaxis protein CheC [Lachnospiraceae bacterium]|nr:chemotaxis protein CheC [Lachnospiraceae bacterium]